MLALQGDVTRPGEGEILVAAAVRRFGALDVLVHNAGVITVGPVTEMSEEDFARQMDVHFWGPLRLTLAALSHLRRAGAGRIVDVTSIGGRIAVPHLGPYSASKAALVGLSDLLRAEGLAPGLARRVSALAARALPDGSGDGTGDGGEAIPGWRVPKGWIPKTLRHLGDRAARQNLETVGTGR